MENNQEKQVYAWGSLWTKPRHTIRALIDSDPHKNVFWLALCHGVISGLYWVQSIMLSQSTMHFALIYSLCIIVGAAYGVGMLYLVSWIYTFCGKWLGGIGTYTNVKCAVGWSYYPFIVAGLIALFSYYFVPNLWWMQIALALASSTAFIWGLVVLFKVIAEAHHFGSWKAIATVIIAILIVLGAVTILSWLFTIIGNIFNST